MAYDRDEDEEKGGINWKDAVVPIILVLFFLLAIAIRGVYYWGPAVEPLKTYGGQAYVLSGNDPDYHKRVVDYIQATHTHLIWDPDLNYPAGAPNPNPPLYAWSVALMGYLIAPFFHGDISTATWYMMEWAAAFWAALTVFPTYIFTRDMFGKKAGIWSAFFIAVMAGNVERTPVGFSDHDAFYVFFIVLTFLFLMRALRLLNTRTYVKNYFNAKSLSTGTYELLSENKKSFLYAILAAISISAVFLTWKGIVYIDAILLVYFVFHMAIKKMRQEEGLGIALIVLLVAGLPLLMCFPYYSIDYFASWFESPFFVFAAMCILALLLVPTRDLPWLLVVPLISILVFGGAFVLLKAFPDIMRSIMDLQGYFVKTKLYETIAEAQAPDYSRMVFSYGVMTFYMALLASGFAVYRLPAEKWRNDYIITVIWAIFSIYMALSATRFMYNATPVFAIMAGWATYALVKMTGYGEMLRSYQGLKTDRLYAIRKSVKPRHVLTGLFVVGLIIMPNIFYGLDAGIPYEKKGEFDKKIYDAMPTQLRPTKTQYSSASNEWWLGSFGTDYPSKYWDDGLFWLADQDTGELPADRPAFISWWDYGHWAVHMGEHPTAADNFQNGFQWAGQYIAAQNESEAIALTTSKLIDGNMYKDKGVLNILQVYVGKDERDNFVDYSVHPADYKSHVLSNPQIYGPISKDRTDPINIKWLMMSHMLTSKLSLDKLVDLNHDLEVHTGQSMRYFAMDTRLLPVGPRNTGIYYAPIKLADESIDNYLVVYAIGNDGSQTNVNDAAAIKLKQQDTNFKISAYTIEYTERFYNSMFYRCYVGWKPMDAEINEPGIPTVSRAADVGMQSLTISNMPPLQGWGMSHYRLAYRTVYWNPNATAPSEHPNDWKIITPAKAAMYENWSKSNDTTLSSKAGVVDYTYRGLFGGVFFLKYYDGAFVNGTVTLKDGTPLAGARVTVYDDEELLSSQWPGIPHGYTYTDANGHYSIVAPFGNVTVRVSNGGQTATGNARTNQLLMQTDKRILNDSKILISDNQAMRIKEDLNSDGIWDYNINHDVAVNFSTIEGTAYWDLNSNGNFDNGTDAPMTGMVALTNSSNYRNQTTTIAANGSFVFNAVAPDDYSMKYVPADGQKFQVKTGISADPSATVTQNIGIKPSTLSGTVTEADLTPVAGIHMVLNDRINNSLSYGITTDVNGTYKLSRVLSGNYTLKVDDQKYSALDVNIDIAEGATLSQNVTVSGTVAVSGVARMPEGLPPTGAILVARNLLDDGLSVNLRVGSDGKIYGHLAPGNYSINGKVIEGSDTYVFMETLVLEKDTVLQLTFKKAYTINGTVFQDLNGDGKYTPPATTTSSSSTPSTTLKEAQSDVQVEFDGPLGNISLETNLNGGYEVYLVPGTYVVYAYSTSSGLKNLSLLKTITVDANKQLNLEADRGTQFQGTVYYDQNLNSMVDTGEALNGALVTFDDGNTTLVKHSNVDGSLSLYMPDGSYTVGVQYAGYKSFGETINIVGGSMFKNIVLNPSNITVTGIVGVDQDGNGKITSGEGIDVILKFVPKEQEGTAAIINIESHSDGTFSTALFPVGYTVQVDQTMTTPEGEVHYKYSADLNLSIGLPSQDISVPVSKLYKVAGNVFYDLNGNGLLNLGERRSPAVNFYDIKGIQYAATVSPDGYSIYLTGGTYYYYAHIGEPASPSKQSAILGHITVGAETKLDMMLIPATRLNGVMYYDANGNGKLDIGEQERDVTLRVSEKVGEAIMGSVTATTNDIGEYTMYLPWGINYTISVDFTQPRKYLNRAYNVKYTYEKRISTDVGDETIVQDLSVSKFYRVWGNVTYVSPTGPIKLAGAQVKFGTFTTTSNSTGAYSLFVSPGHYWANVSLAGFTLPKTTFGNRSVDYDTTQQDFNLDPLNVTLDGHIFLDVNGDGIMQSTTEGIQAQSVEFIAADFRAINASTTTDPRGKFTIELKPGSYYVWVQSASGIHHYVMFERFGLNASGLVAVHNFQVHEGVTLQGDIYLTNTDHQKIIPMGVNITLEQNKTGIKKTFRVTGPGYTYYLPPGEYNFTATYSDSEYSQKMVYDLDLKVNLTERSLTDMVFLKEFKYFTQVTWTTTEKATLKQNSSVTYHFAIKNVGNEPGTWELFATPPTTWLAKPSLEKVTLGIGESKDFSVLVNVSTTAGAGDNQITVGGRITDLEAVNVTSAYVNVIQVFNLSLTSSTVKPTMGANGMYTYHVSLKNDGNGADKVHVYLAAPFPGWNITVTNREPTMSKGQVIDIPLVLIPEDPMNMTGREMTMRIQATSQSGKMVERNVTVSFPDLSGTVTVSGPGINVHKSSAKKAFIPGLEPMLAVAAVTVAAVAVYYRRRGVA
jgi:asparagine N-glycosylation enzyme membrane subunit Stt3